MATKINTILAQQVGNTYVLKFRYDPILVEMVREVPGRVYDPTSKSWIISKDRLGFFINQIKGTPYESMFQIEGEEQVNINATLDFTKKQQIPDEDLSDVKLYVKEGGQLYEHQIDFMKYAIHNLKKRKTSGFLNADDMGLGKSLEAINLAMYGKAKKGWKHCLIICNVNSSKFNWYDEVRDHTRGEEHAYILGTRINRKTGGLNQSGSTTHKLADVISGHMYGKQSEPELPYFLITNIESFHARKGKSFVFSEEILRMINSGEINMIVIDEAHKNMSMSSASGKQILKLKLKATQDVFWLPMTGTPVKKSPLDLYLPLRLIDAHDFDSYYIFSNYFCLFGGFGGHDIVGYRNIPYLKEILHKNMIRRKRTEVLDLPPKIIYDEYVENTPTQQNLYSGYAADIIRRKQEILQELNPMNNFLVLRQVNGYPEHIDHDIKVDSTYIKKNAKLKRLLELLEDIHERGEKAIVFSNWVEPLRTLYTFVSQIYKTCVFTGTMKDEIRQKHKEVFQSNPNYTVMLGTIGALGTTHTLTAANNIIFYDEPWNPSDKTQAEDRVCRIGQQRNVNIYTILTKNTVDEAVHRILETKEGVSNYIVDNKFSLRKNPELFDQLFATSM